MNRDYGDYQDYDPPYDDDGYKELDFEMGPERGFQDEEPFEDEFEEIDYSKYLFPVISEFNKKYKQHLEDDGSVRVARVVGNNVFWGTDHGFTIDSVVEGGKIYILGLLKD